jgi:hypothetical protein
VNNATLGDPGSRSDVVHNEDATTVVRGQRARPTSEQKVIVMNVSAIASHVSDSGMVGNPKRTRGLDAAMLAQPAAEPEATLVGNPRRIRGLSVEDFKAA